MNPKMVFEDYRDDGHQRLTRSGEDFHVVGGTEESHGDLVDRAIAFHGKLKRDGKDISKMPIEELVGRLDEVGLEGKIAIGTKPIGTAIVGRRRKR